MAFPQNFLEEVVARNDIESVVGEYVRFTRRSGSNIFGLCPFHSEKSGSFAIRPSTQTYHCFGCGKGGGVINFLMEIENLSYPEAVKKLADRAGIPVPEEADNPAAKKRKRLLELNRDAARFYFDMLNAPAGQPARDYIAKRGISPRCVKNFGLGFAPDSWDSLRTAMRDKGYTDWELMDAGLASKSDKNGRVRFYDKFRNRLMFPIINVQGDVIGFSGRTLGNDAAKYMNSPDTMVYDKSRNLFALNLAKKTKAPHFILVEGNVDVVALHQAGFDCAVASLGTALTEQQAQLLSRYKQEIIIAYDNDGAGAKATQRAIPILEKLGIKVKVLQMDGAKDPDEFIKAKGPDAFQQLIDASSEQMDYRLRCIKQKYNLDNPEQRVDYVKEAAAFIARSPDEAKRCVYASVLAQDASITTAQVTSLIETERKRLLKSAGRTEERDSTKVVQRFNKADGEHYRVPASAKAERGILRLLLLDPALGKRPELPPPEDFTADNLRNIYTVLLRRIREGAGIDPNLLGEELTQTDISLLVALHDEPVSAGNTDHALADFLRTIAAEKTKASADTSLEELARRLREEKGFGDN